MKKEFTLLMAVLAAMSLVSCQEKEPETSFTLITPTAYEVEWRADTLVVEYSIENPTESGAVIVEPSVSWITVNSQTYGKIFVYVAENTEYEDRTAVLTLEYEDIEYAVSVTQGSRVWDKEVICTSVLSAFNYGESSTPGTGLYFTQFMISDKSESFDPEGSYFLLGITFAVPEDPEDSSIPAGTYNFGTDYGDMVLVDGNSRYMTYPDGNTLGKHYVSGRLLVEKDGNSYVVDLDAVTEDDMSIHARYEGPIEFTKYW